MKSAGKRILAVILALAMAWSMLGAEMSGAGLGEQDESGIEDTLAIQTEGEELPASSEDDAEPVGDGALCQDRHR